MKRVAVSLLALSTLGAGGCAWFVRKASDIAQDGNRYYGITYYVGGAGPIGHIGSLDVPLGLQDAGYPGYVEVFTWQGLTHAGDQIDLSKNREKASELADSIKLHRLQYPGTKVNIVALSAGTGLATFALEYLPEGSFVDNVVFLGCSMSCRYDLTRALKRIRGRLVCVYSSEDRVLQNVVWYTGTVDRASAAEGIAGLRGFETPGARGDLVQAQYRKLVNVAYRTEFAAVGYRGGHLDSTARGFIRDYVAGFIMGKDERLIPGGAADRRRRPPAVESPGARSSRPPPARGAGRM